MSESSLIKELKAGSGKAFRDLVEMYQGIVVNTCYSFLNNKEEAEDIAQEVFIEVFRSIASFKEGSSLSTWLYRISVNKSIDSIRKRNRKKRIQNLIGFYDRDDNQIIDLPSKTADPGKELEKKEQLAILKQTIASLPENQKIAFNLNKFEDLSPKEIAEIMEISLSSVEALLFRAKKKLRDLLREFYTNFYE